jgi:iron complex outermembrane receptor protein
MRGRDCETMLQRMPSWHGLVLGLIAVVLSAPVGSALAQNEPESGAPLAVEQALEDLLVVLEQETELATKTKLNIDFVPGMVSVLHGKDLVARGKRTVYEALELIPGIELSKSNDGQLQVIVRGVGKTFSSGKVKFLLNGVPFNTTLNAITTALIIPTDLVDRIEVIRGPGSAIYGEFASVGVINIVTNTKTQNTHSFARYSDDERYTLGAQYGRRFDNGLSVSANAAYEEREGGNVQAGDDILASSPNPAFQNISNAPGPVNDKEQNKVFMLDLGYQNLNLNWQYVERAFGDYFGAANALPENEQEAQRKTIMQSIELSDKVQLGETASLDLKLGWLYFRIDSEQIALFPKGFALPYPGGDFSDEGVLGAPNYKEYKTYMGADFSYGAFDKHDLLFGLDLSQTVQGNTYAERNYFIDGNGRLVRIPNGEYRDEYNWMAEGLSRRVLAAYVQDQYAIGEKWTLTAGVRWDDYSDIGGDVMPRTAAVYHLSDIQTIKAQYARSFRPPTFLEMNVKNNAVVMGNSDLSSEQLDNFELGYVYNDGGLTIGRATYFYYDLKDLIVIDTTTKRYQNQGEIHARGVELEYVKQWSRRIKLDGNFSYTEGAVGNGEHIPGVAHLMGNFGVLYQSKPGLTYNVQYRYMGNRERQAGDARADLDDYHVFDVAATKSNLLTKGLTLHFGIKNIFDENVVYPSFLVTAPDQNVRPGYAGDYPQTGREVVIFLDYQF